ncbi:unnamed protein product, partial [Tilletia caries]
MHHRVVLNTQNLNPQHPAKISTQDQLLNRVSGPIQTAIGKRPLSVDRLRSGDVAINLANHKEVEALLQADDKWISSAFFSHHTLPMLRRQDFSCTRSLVVHGVPFKLGDDKDLRTELDSKNDVKISKSRWLTSEASRKAGARQHGSVIITVEDASERSRLLKRGVTTEMQRDADTKNPAAATAREHTPQTVKTVSTAGRGAKRMPGRLTDLEILFMIKELKVIQYNCHNEPEVISALLNNSSAQQVDILCLQEPYTYYINPVSHPDWTVFGRSGPVAQEAWGSFPREQQPAARPRVLTYVNNKRLNIANVNTVGLEHPDLISIQVGLERSDGSGIDDGAGHWIAQVVITNLYNPVRSSDTIPPLLHSLNLIQSDHHLLVGDFNAHHPLWQTNVRSISRHAEAWITAIQALNLELVTPADTRTYQYGGSRALFSTIDLSFASDELRERVVTTSGRFNMRKCDPLRLLAETRRAWGTELNTLPPLDSKESVASWAEATQRAMITGMELSTPLAKPSPRSQDWYDEGIKNLGSLTNSARRHWQDTRTEDTWRFYVYLRNKLKSTVRTAKRQQRKAALAQADGRSLWKHAKAGRAAGGVGIVCGLRNADGTLSTAPADKENILREGFWGGVPRPSNIDTAADDDLFTVSSATAEAAWAAFSPEEVRTALHRSAKNTAPGPDQVPWEVLMHLSRLWPEFNALLAHLYTACIRYGHHPKAWKQAVVVVLRKPNKPDYSVAKAYRPISLLNTTAKLLEGLVARRILRRAETEGLVPSNHYGGRPFRSTEDALLGIVQFIKHAQRNGRHVALLTADVAGAYNDVQGRTLSADLEHHGWPEQVILWVQSFMSERSSRLRFADYIGELFDVPDSLPQGSPLSQLLWLVYSGGLVGANGRDKQAISVGWVDDWNTAVSANDTGTLQRRLQTICDRASDWAETHQTRFDQTKTRLCIIPAHANDTVSDVEVTLQGRAVEKAPAVKILGVTLQEDRKFDTHVSETVRKATSAAGSLLSWGNRAWGFSADNMRQLYTLGVLPIMEYACAVWLPSEGFRGGLGALNKFRRVQRSAAIRITGAFRSTSTPSLDFEAGLTPIHLRMYERQALSLLRLRTVPNTHPLATAVDKACRTQPKRMKGPLHFLAAAYRDVATAKVGRRLVPDSTLPVPMPITIPDTKEAALAFHQATVHTTFPQQLHVYTDGSGHDGRYGAAAHFRGGNAVSRPADLRIGLGRMSTVYRSEATAMRAALEVLPAGVRAYVWTDSRAVALALRKPGTTDPDIQASQAILREHGDKISVAWMPGHVDDEGNDAADAAAKEAADLDAPTASEEPAAVRMWVKRRTQRAWQREWNSSSKGASHRNTNTLRAGKTRKLYKGLSRSLRPQLSPGATSHQSPRYKRLPML